MGITKDAIRKRLEKLAVRKGLCPKHMVPLWCTLASEWLGTSAEWQELGELIERLEPGTPMPSSGILCPKCGEELYCIECGQQFYANVPERQHDLSPDEYKRYWDLIHQLIPTPGEHHDKDFFRALSRVPPSPPPIPLPVPAPVASIPIPIPAPVVDADDAIDAELADIVQQIKRRLAQ